MPDRVVPSQLNCVESIDGVDGPLAISKRARSVSIPALSECCEMSVKFQVNLFESPILKRKYFDLMKNYCRVNKIFFILLSDITYHVECGFDCTFFTPPSTGTVIDTFSRGDAEAIEWLLYL